MEAENRVLWNPSGSEKLGMKRMKNYSIYKKRNMNEYIRKKKNT